MFCVPLVFSVPYRTVGYVYFDLLSGVSAPLSAVMSPPTCQAKPINGVMRPRALRTKKRRRIVAVRQSEAKLQQQKNIHNNHSTYTYIHHHPLCSLNVLPTLSPIQTLPNSLTHSPKIQSTHTYLFTLTPFPPFPYQTTPQPTHQTPKCPPTSPICQPLPTSLTSPTLSIFGLCLCADAIDERKKKKPTQTHSHFSLPPTAANY